MDWTVTATPPVKEVEEVEEEKKGNAHEENEDVHSLSLKTDETFYDFIFYGAFMIPDLAHLSEICRREAELLQTVGRGMMHEINLWKTCTQSIKTAKLIASPETGFKYRLSSSRAYCDPNFFHRWVDITCTGHIKYSIVNFEKNQPFKFNPVKGGGAFALDKDEFKNKIFDGLLEFAKIFMPNPQVFQVLFSSLPKKTGNINHSLKVCDTVVGVCNMREDEVQDIAIHITLNGAQFSVSDLGVEEDNERVNESK